MSPRAVARTALSLCSLLACLLFATSALAIYPRVASDSQGTWLACDEALIQIVDELWTFYTSADGLPADRVRAVAPDVREVWAATPRGLARMDRNSRRWEAFRAPEPLPSDDVYGVCVDDRYAWVGTAAGAARYDKLAKQWERIDAGPGAQPVFDVLSLGRSVWFATGEGVYRFDRPTSQWRRFGAPEGLDIGAIRQILAMGDLLWFLGQTGIARLDQRSQAISSFGPQEGLPSPLVTGFTSVQGEVWIGTDQGLVVYSPNSDAISPFVYTKGMPGGAVRGIEVATPWVWVATDEGLGVLNTLTGVWEEKREADGLASSPIVGTALAGATLVLLQAGTFQGYQTLRDEWRTFVIDEIWSGKAGEKKDPSALKLNLELIASGEGNVSTSGDSWSHTEQIVPDLRLGAGTLLDGGRSLDASVRLDFGDATRSGIREYDAELRFRGNETDTLRELILSDELRLRDDENEHDLVDDIYLEGIGAYQRLGESSDRRRDPVTVEVEAGLRRGVRARQYFRGTIDYSYLLDHPYVTPRSEIVKVDGMILERDVDYIITHTTGQLTFLNPDKVNALSLVEVVYTYEQIPRKSTASSSILELLPWDDELGAFKRAGSTVYVTDETGLFKQIDGAAPKYLDRGWIESVFQDYTQSTTTVSLQIHDMGTPEQAIEIFDYDRPLIYTTIWEDADSTALLDESLPSSYSVKMRMERYYVELAINDHSESAKNLIRLFAQLIQVKSDLAGTLQHTLRPLIGRAQLGVNPSDHWGLGVSYMGGQDLRDEEITRVFGAEPRSLEMASCFGWTQHELGSGDYGGKLSSYFQLARSRMQQAVLGSQLGHAASGDILYNSPALNLRLDGEAHSRDFDAYGTRNTPLGTFAGDIRADATLSPVRWLRLRLLYDHERSYLAPELSPDGTGGGTGINTNLIGKLTFMRAKWPTVWLLAGRSVLEGGGRSDEKLRLAGMLEYDMAKGLLSMLRFNKLAIKAYFDHSTNETPVLPPPDDPAQQLIGRDRWLQLGSSPGTAQNMRFELKLAPTSTEDAYARFERKTFEPDVEPGAGSVLPPLEAWELLMGAASRYIPGLVPTFNGKLSYSDGGDGSGEGAEKAQAMLSGQLMLFPGRWLDSLGSAMLQVGYGFTNAEEASYPLADPDDRIKQVHQKKNQVEAKAAYGKYDDVFRVESRGKWWIVDEVPEYEQTHRRTEQYCEVLNRLTFRPIYTSPITLRADYSRLEQVNPQLDPDGSQMGLLQKIAPSLEWERRWSLDLVTKLRLEVPIRILDNAWDEIREQNLSYEDWALRPWAEIRLRLRDLWAGSLLRLAYRGYFQWAQPFAQAAGGESGAERAWEIYSSVWLDWERAGAFIVRLGVIHLWHKCESIDIANPARAAELCLATHSIQPTLKAIVRF
ncbi:MAG: hypothetical protein JXR96_22055 [Deltaproteobacteria bacterium]|nr:hypothetical protein [Deltaproteobacteria bacterium]